MDGPSIPLTGGRYNDHEAPNEWLARSLECREYLLEADADPTLESDHDLGALHLAIGDNDAMNPNESVSRVPLHVRQIVDTWKAFLDLILRKGDIFFDPTTTKVNGRKVWLEACRTAWCLNSPKVLQNLVDADCDPKETNTLGWNGLFYCVLCAHDPASSKEMEALVCLLRMPIDREARDSEGLTISDHLSDSYGFDCDVGSYRRDLWRCARVRAGLANDGDSWTPRYSTRYTPWHFRALRYLDRWEIHDKLSELLKGGYPLTEEDVQNWADANSDGDDDDDADGFSDEDIDESTFEGVCS